MRPKVSVGRYASEMSTQAQAYRSLVGDELMDEILVLGRELGGIRICHLNSTAFGGGVAELLARHLPLLRAVGVSADWLLIRGEPEFFTVTKGFHNALQGAPHDLTEVEQGLYLRVNEQSAKLLPSEYDVYVVHDPQPTAVRQLAGARGARWIWRCHIDSSAPDPAVSGFLKPFIEAYDASVFTMPQFLLPGLRMPVVAFIPPAIDPLATKNMSLPMDFCKRAIADSGIDPRRPLLVQVARFDPWKDPLGVIQAYRLVKEQVPGVQLALVGAMAGDDPEGWALLERVEEESAGDPDLFVFTNLGGVGNMEVNVFQRGCDVVIQKSIREG